MNLHSWIHNDDPKVINHIYYGIFAGAPQLGGNSIGKERIGNGNNQNDDLDDHDDDLFAWWNLIEISWASRKPLIIQENNPSSLIELCLTTFLCFV